MQIKQKWITERIRLSINVFGKCPEKLAGIITTATAKLALLISRVLTAARELKNKLFHEALEKEYGRKADVKAESTKTVDTIPATEKVTVSETTSVTVNSIVPKAEVAEPPKPQIPPRPVMPPEAAAFPRLQKVKVTIDKHNNLIFEAERERNQLEIERDDLKGLARLTKKKELESRIATKNEEIRILKAGLSGIVRQHGFATVQDFYTALHTAQNALYRYPKWEASYGEKSTQKAETVHERLQRHKEKVDRQKSKNDYKSKDNGAR